MSQFNTLFAAQGTPVLRQMFGEAATYTRLNGSQISTWVMTDTALGFSGQRNIRAETQLTAELPVTDLLTDPQPGEFITHNGKTYRVDQLLDNDGDFYRVAIR